MFNIDAGLFTRGVLALERMATALEQIATAANELTKEEDE